MPLMLVLLAGCVTSADQHEWTEVVWDAGPAQGQLPPPPGDFVYLTVYGTCPGQATIIASGATPSATLGVLSSPALGSDDLPARAPCSGPTGLAAPLTPRFVSDSDASGTLSWTVNLPQAACSQHVQVLDSATCVLSDTWSLASLVEPDYVDAASWTLDERIGYCTAFLDQRNRCISDWRFAVYGLTEPSANLIYPELNCTPSSVMYTSSTYLTCALPAVVGARCQSVAEWQDIAGELQLCNDEWAQSQP